MRKVYLITFHRAQSYGAFLQAYALQNCEALKDHNPVYIDYIPKRFSYRSFALTVGGGNPFIRGIKFLPSMVVKTRFYICINKYVKKYLKLTPQKYSNPKHLVCMGNSEDIFISGSDQIWDFRYDDVEHVMPYYLDFAQGKKYSYSSSCGEMNYDCSTGVIDLVKEQLLKFEDITVREQNSADELNRLLKTNRVRMMLDPTFLLSETEWNAFIGKTKWLLNEQDFILVYDLYRDEKLRTYAKELGNMTGKRIVNICELLDFMHSATNIINTSPSKLLKLIEKSKHVVTNSFHGCALTINFHKQLHIFLPPNSTQRVTNLIHLFRLENRVVVGNRIIEEEMDYQQIDEILQVEREKAYNYLSGIFTQ